jgi:hypothetical protein
MGKVLKLIDFNIKKNDKIKSSMTKSSTKEQMIRNEEDIFYDDDELINKIFLKEM